jgi:hypothetical protein
MASGFLNLYFRLISYFYYSYKLFLFPVQVPASLRLELFNVCKFAPSRGIVSGKTGNDPNGNGKICFGWVSVRTMLTVGVEQEWEVGQ